MAVNVPHQMEAKMQVQQRLAVTVPHTELQMEPNSFQMFSVIQSNANTGFALCLNFETLLQRHSDSTPKKLCM